MSPWLDYMGSTNQLSKNSYDKYIPHLKDKNHRKQTEKHSIDKSVPA
jgi:hypothetical protein